MSMHSKIFTYEVDGLSYTITVYEEDGAYLADIDVSEGAMDVNAIYFGDDDFSGKSDSLGGPLNMNGARLDGEKVQWDEAVELSRPGLGPEGTDKETYVAAGDTLTVELDIESLDEIDVFGIRATSTTTDEGSIKAVSDEPEEPEEPEEPTFEKVFFANKFSEEGDPEGGGYFILDEEPEENPFNVPFLPEGTEPTFDNYVAHFEDIGGDVTAVQGVVFYSADEEGNLEEVLRLDPPEGGFESTGQLLDIYDEAIEGGALDGETGGDGSLNLMAALNLGEDLPIETVEDDIEIEDDVYLG